MPTEIKRLFDFPYYQLENGNVQDALTSKKNGEWVKTSTQEYIDKANTISRALLRLGIKPNDKIAIISSSNRTEWCIMDTGILQIGAQNVPIYPTITADDYAYVLNHSESKYCFVSDAALYKKAKEASAKVPSLKEIYCFEEIEGGKNWQEVLELGKDTGNQDEVEALKKEVKPDDLATLIYTSGTTGLPKGVMISHNNIVSNVLACKNRLPLVRGEKVLSFLPLCHVFERMIIYLYQYTGTSIYFAEAIDKIGQNLNEVNPSFMTAVPRLLEKIYDGIIAKGNKLTGIKKLLFFWAVKIGNKYEPYEQNGWWYEKKLTLARKLILSKWKDALGGNLHTMVSGSAALQPRLARVFCAAEMYLMEGYGLTETSPVVSVGKYADNNYKIGTVGKPIDDVEVKIAEDGEILIKGPNVMQGYYKDSEKTAEVMTGEYFHTGDKGEIDSDGFLKITGRKKEIFKTSGGKYVSPALLENELKQSLFIEQVMVVGEGEKMPAAIVQPNFDFVNSWAKENELSFHSNDNLISNKQVLDRIQEEVVLCNTKFAKWEQIKRFELTPDIWTVDNNLLTPTFKPKRTEIQKKYQGLYDKIYR